MILYPKIYLKNVKEITKELINKYEIQAIILDVDNTLISYDRQLLKGVDKWCQNLKKHGIKFCILSNSNKKEKVKKVAESLEIEWINFGKKPLKLGFNKAQKILQVEPNKIAVVGDQIFTDILGANRCKMISILVEPIEEKDIFITRLKRPIEQLIIRNYLKSSRRG